MPTSTGKPIIFISYAHRDEPDQLADGEVRWLTFVQSFLQPAVRGGLFEVWEDRQMKGGADWNAEIETKLRACDIFILLVSRFSMASGYIIDKEIAITRARQAAGESVHFYPLLLTPTPGAGLDKVRDKNLRPRDAKPFSSFSINDRDQRMSDAADEIAAIAAQIVTAQPAAASRSRANVPEYVNISDLPETGYERLVGRDDELKRLDEAWADPKISIVSLIAEGGAGKSALVNEWLERLQADDYRGATTVLGWSFYSQGTKERATSADGFLNWVLGKLDPTNTTTSATAKGEAIAESMMRRRILLVLDGVEPLQYGPDGQLGQLKDQGLRSLLRRFAATAPGQPHGLIVLTSRLAVADIRRWSDSSAPTVDVESLSDEAGAVLLRDNGVWGTDKQLRAASQDFGGHPLALGLLASFLAETQSGDVRRRDRIRAYFEDDDNPRHGHARRVMDSYEKEWLAGQPVLLAILRIVGLFDRPASVDCLRALRAAPSIEGLTDRITTLDDEKWQRAVTRLRDLHLLAPEDPTARAALDAHPLVREWFGAGIKNANEGAWKAGHGRLYEHLRDSTREGDAPTLETLDPLFQAIAHGCRATRYQEALVDVYLARLCRQHLSGQFEFYASSKLGAISSDLAALSWFFEKPFEAPLTILGATHRTSLLGLAALRLRSLGRFSEALPALRTTLHMCEESKNWRAAAVTSCNLSEAELLVGQVSSAYAIAKRAISHADRSGDPFQMMCRRTTFGDALNAAGDRNEAENAFTDAESRQRNMENDQRFLYSVRGFQYCDLLISKGDFVAARDRAIQTVKIARFNGWLLDIALDTLTLGRADLASTFEAARSSDAPCDLRQVGLLFEEAVQGLRAAGVVEWLARGLLSRASYHRYCGDWGYALRDLDEVEEIAEPALMRLLLCDLLLERVRLATARSEAFAPLKRRVELASRDPTSPEIVRLKAAAQAHLEKARDLVKSCGYHRRDEELAELEAVLAGQRTMADLPIRV